MKNKYKIAVIGGDLRQYSVAKELVKSNAEVICACIGMDNKNASDVRICDCVKEVVSDADAVIMPLPVSLDAVTLNCPSTKCSERIALLDIVNEMKQDGVLFGGRIPQGVARRAQEKGIEVIDYFSNEKLQIKNAYITAEAAVSIAMNSLNKCIRETRIVVTGTGRISRFLTEMLLKLGADVAVAARNADSLAYPELSGCKTVLIAENDGKKRWYDKIKNGYDIIFNTVPAWIFDRNFLESCDRDLLIIELASAPGGVDICSARELSRNVIWASSLPGKYAPVSAGKIIGECIYGYLTRMEVSI